MAIKFLLLEGIKNVLRNKSNFILSSIVCGLCLLLLTIFLIITINILKIKTQIEDKFEIFVFLDSAADPQELQEKLENLHGVRNVLYVPPDEAYNELKTDLSEHQVLLDILDYNPLPASFRVKIDPNYKLTQENLASLENKIKILPGVTDVWSGADLLIKLQKIIRTVIGFDLGIMIVVFIAVIFIVSRTVEMTILARTQEIEIMKLVGASNTTVTLPFYFQGFFNGFAGAVITIVTFLILSYFLSWQFPLINFAYQIIIPLNIFTGVFLGLGGSYLGLSRVVNK
ncbi:MAG: permease-like cell division protein FtsX [candidate division WOR-3 bacterium]|nr:permease-like cell division protein FtsX [candidate division WOR-3 bacterium]MCX7757432.1 permease-like cell division protein FtsX [candidate division WOR-3 bacterium]MDW7988189.1 permease-like cell division protein FtsX [candidate division WOR-3 bacterium]